MAVSQIAITTTTTSTRNVANVIWCLKRLLINWSIWWLFQWHIVEKWMRRHPKSLCEIGVNMWISDNRCTKFSTIEQIGWNFDVDTLLFVVRVLNTIDGIQLISLNGKNKKNLAFLLKKKKVMKRSLSIVITISLKTTFISYQVDSNEGGKNKINESE